MSFFVFELIFAGLVLALLVIAFLVWRQLRREREDKAYSTLVEPKPAKPAKPRLPGLGRKPPPPQPEEVPPPVRKRQLRSLSEVERDAAEEAKEEAEVDDGAPVPVPAEPPKFNQRVLARLETAFERLQAQKISLDAYVAQVRAEQAEVDQRIAALRAAGDAAGLDEALAAQESVRWCLDWANEQRGQGHSPA